MIKLKKVLFPTDLSDATNAARKYAMAFAGQFQAELHILSVVQDAELLMPDPNAPFLIPANDIAEIITSVEGALTKIVPPAEFPSIPIIRHVETGTPLQVILDYAKANEIDLIVLGTHGRTGLAHLLLGSTAEHIVRNAPCPVLTVHSFGHQFVPE